MAKGDYFPPQPGPLRVNPAHTDPYGLMSGWGNAPREFKEGLTKNGLLVHLYGDGTRVVLKKSPGPDHWLFHAALDRVSGGHPGIKAQIIKHLAPVAPGPVPVHGNRQILPGARHVARGLY